MVSPGVINHRFKSRATLCIGYFDCQYVSTFKTFVIRKLAPETAGVRPETFNYTGVCMYVCMYVCIVCMYVILCNLRGLNFGFMDSYSKLIMRPCRVFLSRSVHLTG